MKKLLIILLAVLTVASFASCGSAAGGEGSAAGGEGSAAGNGDSETNIDNSVTGEYSVAEMAGSYKTQGRTILYDKGLAMLSSADIFEFNADCSGAVSVMIYAETTEDSGDTDVYFTGYVDGARCDERFWIDSDGEHEIALTQDVQEGSHSFRIVRQTEWNHGDIYVTGVKVNGKLTDPPENKELFIEFIGDSLTTGYGNMTDLPDNGQDGGAPVFQDATQAYPYMVAEALDADISVVAIQGIGCACGFQPFTMGEIYSSYPRVNEKDYTYVPQRQPDVVVINLLANDSDCRKDAGLGKKDVVDKAIEFVKYVREIYPEAKIIFAPPAYDGLVAEGLNELGGEAAGYYVTMLPMDNGRFGHPTVDGHTSASQILAPFITSIISAA